MSKAQQWLEQQVGKLGEGVHEAHSVPDVSLEGLVTERDDLLSQVQVLEKGLENVMNKYNELAKSHQETQSALESHQKALFDAGFKFGTALKVIDVSRTCVDRINHFNTNSALKTALHEYDSLSSKAATEEKG